MKGKVLYLIKSVNLGIQLIADPLLRDVSLTVTQYELLAIVRANDGLANADIARDLGISPQSVGEQVSVLERKGFLVRQKGLDNRKIRRLALTPSALAVMESADDVVDQLQQRLLAGLNKADEARMVAALKHLRTSCRELALDDLKSL